MKIYSKDSESAYMQIYKLLKSFFLSTFVKEKMPKSNTLPNKAVQGYFCKN